MQKDKDNFDTLLEKRDFEALRKSYKEDLAKRSDKFFTKLPKWLNQIEQIFGEEAKKTFMEDINKAMGFDVSAAKENVHLLTVSSAREKALLVGIEEALSIKALSKTPAGEKLYQRSPVDAKPSSILRKSASEVAQTYNGKKLKLELQDNNYGVPKGNVSSLVKGIEDTKRSGSRRP